LLLLSLVLVVGAAVMLGPATLNLMTETALDHGCPLATKYFNFEPPICRSRLPATSRWHRIESLQRRLQENNHTVSWLPLCDALFDRPIGRPLTVHIVGRFDRTDLKLLQALLDEYHLFKWPEQRLVSLTLAPNVDVGDAIMRPVAEHLRTHPAGLVMLEGALQWKEETMAFMVNALNSNGAYVGVDDGSSERVPSDLATFIVVSSSDALVDHFRTKKLAKKDWALHTKEYLQAQLKWPSRMCQRLTYTVVIV
jgi:hypothetical protein